MNLTRSILSPTSERLRARNVHETRTKHARNTSAGMRTLTYAPASENIRSRLCWHLLKKKKVIGKLSTSNRLERGLLSINAHLAGPGTQTSPRKRNGLSSASALVRVYQGKNGIKPAHAVHIRIREISCFTRYGMHIAAYTW